MALLPILRRLAPSPSPTASSTSSTSTRLAASNDHDHLPKAEVLGHLLAHIFNNNYTILSAFRSSLPSEGESSDDPVLGAKLGELVLRWGPALPLLWAYLWGMDEPSAKGKAKANPQQETAFRCGVYERDDEERGRMVDLTFRVILTAAQSSTANLFLIDSHLPQLKDFLVTRLYGIEPKRKYEATFPPRDDWHVREEGEEEYEEETWYEPSPALRALYFALLRRMLEAGVTQQLTWRLFTLARSPSKPTPADTTNGSSPYASEAEPTPLQDHDTPRPRQKSRRPPHLTIATSPSPAGYGTSRLQVEVLDLIRHAMKARWPAAFVFRGGQGDEEGGLELWDMGRPWPAPLKGFHFSVSRFSRLAPTLTSPSAGYTSRSSTDQSPSCMFLRSILLYLSFRYEFWRTRRLPCLALFINRQHPHHPRLSKSPRRSKRSSAMLLTP